MPEIVYVALKFTTLLALYVFIIAVVRSLYLDLLPRERRVKADSAKAARLKKATTPWLKVMSEGKTASKRYNLRSETIIGRDAGCQICLDDEFISQLHARVVDNQGRYILEDLGSTNGTYVNGRKINYPVDLRHGDRIKIGGTLMEFRR